MPSHCASGLLSSGLSLLLLLGLVNLFVGVNFLFNVSLYGGLLLFCGFVLFDTQLLIEKRRNGDSDFIWYADTCSYSYSYTYWICALLPIALRGDR